MICLNASETTLRITALYYGPDAS
jgi:hypothetical protein